MKKLLILLSLATLFGLTLAWFVSDRDRALWLLNNAISLTNSRDVVTDVVYGEKEWQKLDIYPQEVESPVVVFIHGGSWRHGRKDQYFFAADAFIRLGYTVVLPDYLKHPSPQALAGHSAGAHTAAMLATDAQFLSDVGLSENDIRAVAGIAGPYSFIPNWEVTKAVFGPPERYPLMDALNYVDGSEPATFLLHSKADAQVGQYNQEKLASLMNEKGVDVETALYDDLSHIDMVTHLHPWFSREFNIASEIDRFFRARLQNALPTDQ